MWRLIPIRRKNRTKVRHEEIHVVSKYSYMHAETMTSITQPDVHSIGIQCNLLAAPPLKIQYKKEESLHSEAEETDVDTSFCVSQEDTTTE